MSNKFINFTNYGRDNRKQKNPLKIPTGNL